MALRIGLYQCWLRARYGINQLTGRAGVDLMTGTLGGGDLDPKEGRNHSTSGVSLCMSMLSLDWDRARLHGLGTANLGDKLRELKKWPDLTVENFESAAHKEEFLDSQ